MSHVVLDLPPALLLWLSATVPLTVLVLGTVAPIAARVLPKALRAALSEPSDGLTPVSDGTSDLTPPPMRMRTPRIWCLGALAGFEALAWTIGTIVMLVQKRQWDTVAQTSLVAASWLFASLLALTKPPISAPFRLFVFSIAQVVLLVLHVISFALHSSRLPHHDFVLVTVLTTLHTAVLFAMLSLIVSFPISSQDARAADKSIAVSASANAENKIFLTSPEEHVTLGAWIVFSWVAPLIARGQKTRLEWKDVWLLPRNMSSEGVRRSGARLKTKSLIKRIVQDNSLDLMASLSMGFLGTFLSYLSPYFLKRILSALTPPEPGQVYDPNLRRSAYIYAILAFTAQICRAQVDLQQLWHERRMIIRVRTGLMSSVYEKALKRRDLSGVVAEKDAALDPKSRKSKTSGDAKTKTPKPPAGVSAGKIVNLMSTDCNKIANQLMSLSSTVTAPFELVIATTFLYNILGWTAFAGLSVMFIALPANHVLVKRRIKIHRSVLASRDQRMEVLNEFIHAIRFVKTSALEPQWLGKVFDARSIELAWLLKTRINNLLINIVWNFTPDVVLLISFACFTKIRGEELTVPVAFTALALFALLRGPMGTLPNSITQLLQTYVSVQRLEAFFDEPEVEAWVSTLYDDEIARSAPEERISIQSGNFRYQDTSSTADSAIPPSLDGDGESESSSFELRDITVDFPTGKLSLIAGPTGSGKTSLLLALLGEIHRVSGQVKLPKGSPGVNLDGDTGLYSGVAYASQLPWLQHDTIKNNILFGSAFEAERYEEVIRECALADDLALFDAGDETEIGEKGISLSGGQKARVALARAVYSRARVVLLDDPLSAVDAHTARHLYTQCLKGRLLENRSIVLVTHHIELCLPGAAFIVRMDTGRIEAQGAVAELDQEEIAKSLKVAKAEEEEEVRQDAATAAKNEKDDAETAASKALSPKADDSNGPTRAPSPANVPSKVKSNGKLVEEEARAEGRVKGSVYKLYLSSAGWATWVAIIALIFAGRSFRVVDRYWFKRWGESYNAESNAISSLYFTSTTGQAVIFDSDFAHDSIAAGLPNLPTARENVNPYLVIYALICVSNLLIMILSILASYRGSFRAARILFVDTLTRITYAPFRYFDTTPTGRILNRFSTDFQIIDTSLTDQVRICLTHSFSFVVNVGVIVLVSPQFVLPACLIVYIYVRLSLSYVRCSRDLRRLESNARSPIFSKFGETLAGIVTARAFGAERRFLYGLFDSVDKMLSVNYASAVVNRYLLWRFDCLGAIAVAITTVLALLAGASPGLAALAITSAQSLVQSVYWLARFISALEVDLNAVERVTELLSVPQEPPQHLEQKPPAIWPSDKGGLSFEDVVVSYAPSLPPVLKGISFDVAPREKVGIVGRTGSGKSTVAMSILRFTDPLSGRIVIDGIDITKIGLHELRSRLVLIPQEAVLFSGTIRSNLDPFDEHTDEECLEALARVRLISAPMPAPSARESREQSRASSPAPRPANAALAGPSAAHLVANNDASSIASSSSGSATRVDSPSTGRINVTLDSVVSSGGNNFSQGQKQLLALARALLRRAPIIVMDEATASVDMDTDAKIQQTIQDEFANALVITIAHRLSTVVDYDKVLVLNSGAVVEYDTPKVLLQKEDGVFRKMCERSADWDDLKQRVGL